MSSAWSKRIMFFPCRLYCWTESKFKIRNHFTAAVSWLIVSDVNFNFSCFGHNHGFCFLQVWRPTVFASTKRCVLLKFGLQDTLSYKVIKTCATLLINEIMFHPSSDLFVGWPSKHVSRISCQHSLFFLLYSPSLSVRLFSCLIAIKTAPVGKFKNSMYSAHEDQNI